jgi:pimeloyl-ACP methyl ester carboxylesterase
MIKYFRNSSHAQKVRVLSRWMKPLLVVASLAFCSWFFYSVYEQRNGGSSTEDIGISGENSKRLRTEVRSWFRQTFPASAARADENFGIFEFDRGDLPVTRSEWVLLAHGLDEPGNLWANLAPALVDDGYRVMEFRYPNDQPIQESSLLLKAQTELLLSDDGLKAPPSGIHLVGHSMGGLVFRNFVTHPELLPTCSWTIHTSVLSLVQLGTPNHGSWLATYRLPVELRDHLFKDFGLDAILGMVWDGAGEAQIDIKPESVFLKNLNSRTFPKSIYWVGVAGIGSPVNLQQVQSWSGWKGSAFSGSLNDLQNTFPELFLGTGDGCVSVDSLKCEDMDAVFFVDATHRSMVRDSRNDLPPAIPIVLEVLEKNKTSEDLIVK